MLTLVRGVVAALLVCAMGTSAALAASEAPADAAAATLQQPLTPETVRDLVSRLSDQEVRKLLIEQLDRGSVRPAGADGAAGAGMGMLGTMADHAGQWRQRWAEIGAAVLALPASTASVVANLRALDGARPPLSLVAIFAAMLVVGWIAEVAWRRITRHWRARHSEVRNEGFFADAIRRGTGFLIDLLGPVVFAAGALAAFFATWQGHVVHRNLVLGVFGAWLLTRAVWLVAQFLLAPSRPAARLLPLPDAAARALALLPAIITGLYAFGTVLGHAFVAGGADAATIDALGVVFSTVTLAVTLFTIWRIRGEIAALIRGAGGGNLARLFADLWPVAASAYVVAVFVARLQEFVAGERGTTAGGILSLLILVGLPIADYALCRVLAAAAAAPPAPGSEATRRLVGSYEPVLRKMIHIVVVVAGLLWLADLWSLNLFAMAQQTLGGRVASSLLGIGLVLLLAYMLWEVVRTAIDRRLSVEQAQRADSPSSRLRTLLPLLRATFLVTIVVMATLSVLAALGVDILPLLAGASVVGVAIGFGSQTLVRDIVTGAFFLMDDAFRLGEYIEVGDAKGRVEKITMRALFLRHHRGALNILPYGEIKRLRNTSRDWMIMVMEFRLAFDTDLKKVKKILKQIGEEIAADPELGPEMLQPLKSQGVMSTDDSAMVVRAKYMARPGTAPFMIRRVAYEKILKAFAAQGIEFASRRVAVYVPPHADDDERRRAAAAAVAHDSATPAPKAAD